MCKAGFIFCFLGMMFDLAAYSQTSWQETVAKALRLQEQADSLQRLAEAQAVVLATASKSQKNSISDALRDFEAQTAAMQKTADEWFARAIALEAPAISADTATIKITSESGAIAESKEIPEPKNIRDYEFAILFKSPYSTAHPVPIGEPFPEGVIYRIQLGAFSKPLPANTFKGLTPLSGEKLDNGVTKYYAGQFRRFADAEDALRKVHEYGFKDAFIVAFYNRKPINPLRAKQLE